MLKAQGKKAKGFAFPPINFGRRPSDRMIGTLMAIIFE
jgi:hypothetical protein